jgi:hypothetical protein
MPEIVFAEIPRIKFRAKGRKETARNNWLIPRVVQNGNQVFWCDSHCKE